MPLVPKFVMDVDEKMDNFRTLAAARSVALHATSLTPHVACHVTVWTRFARPLLQNVFLQTQVVLQP